MPVLTIDVQADVRQAKRDLDGLKTSFRNNSRELDRLNKSASTSRTTFAGFESVLGKAGLASAGLAAGALLLGRSIISSAAEIEQQKRALEGFARSADEAEAQYSRFIETAKRPGVNIRDLVDAATQFQALGFSIDYAEQVTVAFGNALARAGQSSSQLGNILDAFRQIRSEGSLLQEDIGRITAVSAESAAALNRLYGSTRAENIRTSLVARGITDEGAQVATFLREWITELEKLPPAANTAANTFENFSMSMGQLGGAVGELILPPLTLLASGLTAAADGMSEFVRGTNEFAQATAGRGPSITTPAAQNVSVEGLRSAGQSVQQRLGTATESNIEALLREQQAVNNQLRAQGRSPQVELAEPIELEEVTAVLVPSPEFLNELTNVVKDGTQRGVVSSARNFRTPSLRPVPSVQGISDTGEALIQSIRGGAIPRADVQGVGLNISDPTFTALAEFPERTKALNAEFERLNIAFSRSTQALDRWGRAIPARRLQRWILDTEEAIVEANKIGASTEDWTRLLNDLGIELENVGALPTLKDLATDADLASEALNNLEQAYLGAFVSSVQSSLGQRGFGGQLFGNILGGFFTGGPLGAGLAAAATIGAKVVDAIINVDKLDDNREEGLRVLEDFNIDASRALEDFDDNTLLRANNFNRTFRELLLERRRILARRPTGNQRAFETFQDRLALSSRRLRDARENFNAQEDEFTKERATIVERFIEERRSIVDAFKLFTDQVVNDPTADTGRTARAPQAPVKLDVELNDIPEDQKQKILDAVEALAPGIKALLETDPQNLNEIHLALDELGQVHIDLSALTADQIAQFDLSALGEKFNVVTEAGIINGAKIAVLAQLNLDTLKNQLEIGTEVATSGGVQQGVDYPLNLDTLKTQLAQAVRDGFSGVGTQQSDAEVVVQIRYNPAILAEQAKLDAATADQAVTIGLGYGAVSPTDQAKLDAATADQDLDITPKIGAVDTVVIETALETLKSLGITPTFDLSSLVSVDIPALQALLNSTNFTVSLGDSRLTGKLDEDTSQGPVIGLAIPSHADIGDYLFSGSLDEILSSGDSLGVAVEAYANITDYVLSFPTPIQLSGVVNLSPNYLGSFPPGDAYDTGVAGAPAAPGAFSSGSEVGPQSISIIDPMFELSPTTIQALKPVQPDAFIASTRETPLHVIVANDKLNTDANITNPSLDVNVKEPIPIRIHATVTTDIDALTVAIEEAKYGLGTEGVTP